MNKADKYFEARKELLELFGIEDCYLYIDDRRDVYWAVNDNIETLWWADHEEDLNLEAWEGEFSAPINTRYEDGEQKLCIYMADGLYAIRLEADMGDEECLMIVSSKKMRVFKDE